MNTEAQVVEQDIEAEIAKLEQSIQIKNTLVLIETNGKLKQALTDSISATQAEIAKLKSQKFKPEKLAEIISIMKEFSINMSEVKEAFSGTKVAKVITEPMFVNKNNEHEKWAGKKMGQVPLWIKAIKEKHKIKDHEALVKELTKQGHLNPKYVPSVDSPENQDVE